MIAYVTTYTGMAVNICSSYFSWKSSNDPKPPPSKITFEKKWLPEGFTCITQLALLCLYPKGTKLGFEDHCLTLYPPGHVQSIMRTWDSQSRNDLVKLPLAITCALLTRPPRRLPDNVQIANRTITDILNADNEKLAEDPMKFSCRTRIYLFALEALKRMAKTYEFEPEELEREVDDISDKPEMKYLKHSYQFISNALKGELPQGVELQTIGRASQQLWNDKDEIEIDDHLTLGLPEKYESESSQHHRYIIITKIQLIIGNFVKVWTQQGLAVVKTAALPEQVAAAAPVAAPRQKGKGRQAVAEIRVENAED